MCILQSLAKTLEELKIDKSKKVAIAVSGGCDSMALCLSINAIKFFENPIVAMTVDHQLRSESNNEALQVAKWLAKYDVSHKILKWEGNKPASNIQANARNARYELMREYCAINHIDYLFVAHNQNDQAETLLMRLMRGSAVKGLSAIAPICSYNGLSTVRPLLNINKIQIKKYLQSIDQQWIEDPSNQNEKYERVKVRNMINDLDDSELFIRRIANSAFNIARSNSYIEQKVQEESKKVCSYSNLGFATISRREFLNLHYEAQYRILSDVIKNVGGNYYKSRSEKLDNLIYAISDNNIGQTLGGCEIFISKKKSQMDIIYIIREIKDLPEIKIDNKKSLIWDNRFEIKLSEPTQFLYIKPLDKLILNEIERNKPNLISTDFIKKTYYSLPVLVDFHDNISVPSLSYNSKNIECRLIAS